MRSLLGGFKVRVGAAILAGAVGVLTLGAADCLAQPGGGGGGRGGPGGGGGGMRGLMGDMFSAPVASREIEQFSQVAGLSTDQKEAAKTLLEGYQEQFRAKSTKVQKEMDKVREKFQDTRDPKVWEEVRGSMQSLRTERKAVEEQFLADFKLILTPAQTERWPQIERVHRRSQTMGRGMMSGERVDLIEIMESSKFPAEVQATAIPTLSEYEEALDRALVERNKAYDDVASAFQQGGPGTDGFAKAQDLMIKGREASTRVRDLNRKYARQLADILPEEYKATLNEAVKKASYPDVYRTTLADKQIAAAEQFTDLDQAQKDGLAALKESHSRTIGTINEKLAAAITDREEKFDPRQMGRGRGQGGGGRNGGGNNNNEDPVGVLRRERRELDDGSLASLKKILTKAQIERLPDEEADQPRGGRGGQQRGGQRGGNTNQQI